MAALVALPVSLSELLEVRGRRGLSGRELRAVAAQTCRHLTTLLETDGHVGKTDGAVMGDGDPRSWRPQRS